MTAKAVRVASVFASLTLTSVAVRHRSATSPGPRACNRSGSESPVLTPEQSMRTFFMPPGYRVELVASEPLVQDPIVIDFDADGRIWVVEMPTFQPEDDLAATNEREPKSRVVVLEDTNDDGKMDKRTVFADGLVLPRAIKVLDQGVLVGEPPNLWLLRDTNGDLKADTQGARHRYLRHVPTANIEHNANSLFWAMDNWMYTSEHDGYLRAEERQVRDGEDAGARAVGRVAGRWRPHLSQHELSRAARRYRAGQATSCATRTCSADARSATSRWQTTEK